MFAPTNINQSLFLSLALTNIHPLIKTKRVYVKGITQKHSFELLGAIECKFLYLIIDVLARTPKHIDSSDSFLV